MEGFLSCTDIEEQGGGEYGMRKGGREGDGRGRVY